MSDLSALCDVQMIGKILRCNLQRGHSHACHLVDTNEPVYTEAEVRERERLARLDELQRIRSAMPTHDHGEWLAAQLDDRIAALEREQPKP